jgi:hypothetical protein
MILVEFIRVGEVPLELLQASGATPHWEASFFPNLSFSVREFSMTSLREAMPATPQVASSPAATMVPDMSQTYL